jgi:putative transposase
VQRIGQFLAAYDTNCQPFRCTATADSILEKAASTVLAY